VRSGLPCRGASVAMAGGAGPARKNKPMLTLIPEQERSIDYRFEFAIVGEGAKSFAESVVNSEMAEAFRPTAKHEKDKMTEIHEDDEPHEEEPEHEVHGLGQKVNKSTLPEPSSEKNKLILFCPIGKETKALARVRFTCIEQFSDSLPLSRDATVAMNQAVVFLFRPNAVTGDRSPSKSREPLDEFKGDFISRFAEINHTPAKFRPHVRILCFDVEPEVADQLQEIGKTKDVTLYAQPDDGEDTMMESLQGICETLILLQLNNNRTSDVERISNGDTPLITQPARSSCCALL